MNQVLMTIHASLLVSWSGVDHISMSKHGTTLVGDVKKIAVTLLTLVVLE